MNNVNILNIDKLLRTACDTMDNVIVLAEYTLNSKVILEEYLLVYNVPIRVAFHEKGIIPMVHDRDRIITSYLECIKDTIPSPVRNDLLDTDINTLIDNLVRNDTYTCTMCGAGLSVSSSACIECGHDCSQLIYNNSYMDLERVNINHRGGNNSQYREDICIRAFEEFQGKCTLRISSHILERVVQGCLLKSNRELPVGVSLASMVANLSQFKHIFVGIQKADLFMICSRIHEQSKYRLLNQINYIYNLIHDLPAKEYQEYLPKILYDLKTFDEQFHVNYPGKHSINMQYFIFTKLTEYSVCCSKEDFYPMIANTEKHQDYLDAYTRTVQDIQTRYGGSRTG